MPSNQGLHHWAKPQPLLFSKGLRGPRVDFTLVAHWRQSSKNLKALVWLVGWLWAPHSTYALWSFTGKVMHLPLPTTWKLGYITDLVWLRAALYHKVNSISLLSAVPPLSLPPWSSLFFGTLPPVLHASTLRHHTRRSVLASLSYFLTIFPGPLCSNRTGLPSIPWIFLAHHCFHVFEVSLWLE